MQRQAYNYEHLRTAIIYQAVQDYKTALKKNNYGQISALERFFRSEWGQLLSYDNGEYIISECRKIVGKLETRADNGGK